MQSSRLKHGVIIAAAAAILAIGTISASTAFAAKGGGNTTSGGGGGHRGGHTSPTPTPASGTIDVTIVSANPVPLGTAPTFHATGFQPNETVYVIVNGYLNVEVTQSDETGAVTYTWDAITIPGSYSFTAYDAANNWGRVSFTVQ